MAAEERLGHQVNSRGGDPPSVSSPHSEDIFIIKGVNSRQSALPWETVYVDIIRFP